MTARDCFRAAQAIGWAVALVSPGGAATPVGVGTQEPAIIAAARLMPNLTGGIERPLRYRPEGEDFVIANGSEFFNRPLYGGNTAFRVDGGDRPQFVLYLPGRGGNLRLGLKRGGAAIWADVARSIVTRYRPGELRYQIRDPMLGPAGTVELVAVADHRSESLLVRAAADAAGEGLELIWAIGGVSGERGVRDGDIGTEKVPIGQWFQYQPRFSAGNRLAVAGGGFRIQGRTANIAGYAPVGSVIQVGDGSRWGNLPALLEDPAGGAPVVVGRTPFGRQPLWLVIGAGEQGASAWSDPAGAFAAAEGHFAALRRHLSVHTPDPYLDAAVGALNVAADAVWDEPQRDLMHGAIAWRVRLLGWRGAYSLDDLGWPDRAEDHFDYWLRQQNTQPISGVVPPADEAANLSRNETGLHTNGDLSHSHYDMNLVFVDALLRHLRWTGDRALARRAWPVLERHLAWERRNFRREYGPGHLPLYEAYAAIWASDDLEYGGGGSAHGSAYNLFHNRLAAQVAELAGADPRLYRHEADLIERAMRQLLWVPATGMFAEYKDYLGRQLLHPDAAVWSFYHTMDAEFVTAAEGSSMANYVARRIPHLPVRGPGVPPGLETVSESDWMPYQWSLNNVVLAEALHTSLGLWQAGRPDDAWRIARGSLIAGMYMGICPGNVGAMSYLDVYRRESQRDFADGIGVMSRAVVEGLFGIRPDLLSGTVTIRPGLPRSWDFAEVNQKWISVRFRRQVGVGHYAVETRFTQPVKVNVVLPAGEPAEVSVNGRPVTPTFVALDAAVRQSIADSEGSGGQIGPVESVKPDRGSKDNLSPYGPKDNLSPYGGHPIDLTSVYNDRLINIFRHEYRSPRSPFVSLALPKQGLGAWAGEYKERADFDDSGLRRAAAGQGGVFRLPNGVPFRVPVSASRNVAFVSRWDNFPRSLTVPLAGRGRTLWLLMAGSTGPMQSHFENGAVTVRYADGSAARLELRNPETWWPIEQDYFIDDYQFRYVGRPPLRVRLKTGEVYRPESPSRAGARQRIDGGAATVLTLPLDPNRDLATLSVEATANDVVIGLMAATIAAE